MRKKSVAMMALLLPLLLLAEPGPAPADFPALEKNWEPVRSDFNRDAGRVRLLLLLDPT